MLTPAIVEGLRQCRSLSPVYVKQAVGTAAVQVIGNQPDTVSEIISNLGATTLVLTFGPDSAGAATVALANGSPPFILTAPALWPLAGETLWATSSAAGGIIGVMRTRADVG